MRRLLISTLFVLFTAGTALAEPREVKLTAGSILRGEVLLFNASICRIKTANLGTIEIPVNKVSEIRPVSATVNVPAVRSVAEPQMIAMDLQRQTQTQAINAQVQVLQNLLMADPKMKQMVLALQSDPDMIRALSDPKIMGAIQSGNIQALQNNKTILKLMDKEAIRAIRGMSEK